MNGSTGKISKERRDLEQKHIKAIKQYLPITKSYNKKISQIDVLHLLCIYFKSQAHLRGNIVRKQLKTLQLNNNLEDIKLSPNLNGFIMVLTTLGDILHVSENVNYYLQLKADEILLGNEKIFSMISEKDEQVMATILENKTNISEVKPFYVNCNSKKRKSKHSQSKIMKIEAYFTEKKNLFIASCTPILTPNNRNQLVASSVLCFTTAHYLDLKFKEICKSGESLLGYNQDDLLHKQSLYDIIHSSNLELIRKAHDLTIKNKDQLGYLMPVMISRADKTYINCLVNMYYCPKGYIICNYQAFSPTEMKDLIQYYAENESAIPKDARLYKGESNEVLKAIKEIDMKKSAHNETTESDMENEHAYLDNLNSCDTTQDSDLESLASTNYGFDTNNGLNSRQSSIECEFDNHANFNQEFQHDSFYNIVIKVDRNENPVLNQQMPYLTNSYVQQDHANILSTHIENSSLEGFQFNQMPNNCPDLQIINDQPVGTMQNCVVFDEDRETDEYDLVSNVIESQYVTNPETLEKILDKFSQIR